MIIVTSFELKHNSLKGFFTVVSSGAARCPLCGGFLTYRDSRVRKSKNFLGEVRRFLLCRFFCGECKTLHTEIPDIIQPRKHYDSEAIQNALDGGADASACVADDSTIRRWKADFAKAGGDISQRLASIQAKLVDGKVPIPASNRILDDIRAGHARWLPFVMALLVNSGHKLFTQFAFCPPGFDGKVDIVRKLKGKGGGKFDKTIEDSS